MTQDRLHAAADKLEITDLSSNYMRGLDRLDGELERSVFWGDAFCSYGTYEGGPDGFIEYCQSSLATHLSNKMMVGQVSGKAALAIFNETIWSTFIGTIAAKRISPEH